MPDDEIRTTPIDKDDLEFAEEAVRHLRAGALCGVSMETLASEMLAWADLIERMAVALKEQARD